MPGVADLTPYEIYAVKYGNHQRRASANFLGGDPDLSQITCARY